MNTQTRSSGYLTEPWVHRRTYIERGGKVPNAAPPPPRAQDKLPKPPEKEDKPMGSMSADYAEAMRADAKNEVREVPEIVRALSIDVENLFGVTDTLNERLRSVTRSMPETTEGPDMNAASRVQGTGSLHTDLLALSESIRLLRDKLAYTIDRLAI